MACLSDVEVQSFRDSGSLVLSGCLGDGELAAMRADMDRVAGEAHPDAPDYLYGAGHLDGSQVLRRIQYVVDKSPAARAMMGHPRVLAAVEQIAGPDLFPTQDAMVLKMPGQGIAVPWHRDRASTDDYPVEPPVFIADFYVDDADLDTCIWVVPGSHRWSDARTAAAIAERNRDGFSTRGAEPMPLRAGDVLFHNVRLLHGSPPNVADKLRRVVYYTFHTDRAHRVGARPVQPRVHYRQAEGAARLYPRAPHHALRRRRSRLRLPAAGGPRQGPSGRRRDPRHLPLPRRRIPDRLARHGTNRTPC